MRRADVMAVADDPEGAAVFGASLDCRRALAAPARERVRDHFLGSHSLLDFLALLERLL